MEDADKDNDAVGHIRGRIAPTKMRGAGTAVQININNKIVPTKHR